MVVTPWGSSETLRERMLPPGPGGTPGEVAENQRQRLFGAMVASVAERGYESTRVSDLTEVSGVSLRSFYDLFPDKHACFVAAVESLSAATMELVLEQPGTGEWEEDSRRHLATLATLVASQPAAARMCLVEAYVAGGRATELIDGVAERVERLIRERLASSPPWTAMPPEMSAIAVAAILEVFRARLLKGQAERLPQVAAEVASLLLDYEPPVRPLRSAARPPEGRPEEREASDHAERALRAFESLLAEQPYAETTMEQVAKRAGMSARTLYANFGGREELMLAAIDSAGAIAIATVLPAYRRNSSPAEGVRSAIGALFGLLASRPNLAHLLLAGVYEGGAPALGRRAEALQPLETLLMRAAPVRAATRKIVAEAILAGILGLARRRLLEAGAGALSGLAPICTYVALAPLLGAEQATAAAEGKSYRRAPSDLAESMRLAGLRPKIDRIGVALSRTPSTVEEVAEWTSLPREEVEAQIALLEEMGVVERLGGEGEPRYANRWPTLDTEEWVAHGQDEREQLSAEIGWVIKEEVEDAVAAGTFDSRPERFLVRLPVWVDEQGWKELHGALDGSLAKCLDIQRRAHQRLRDRPGEGFAARVLLVSFEMPPGHGDAG